ncbi:LysM peptidoglycan-binding domain-containing protein [Cytophagaceae bacterium ABcell3]|nr:LysM peptidoglycan-binding domain-containing protein [Cytophagaceae bacterium ABcell3]
MRKITVFLLLVFASIFNAQAFDCAEDSIGVSKVEGKVHIRYRVMPGETIYGLSTKYGVQISDLMEINPELVDGLKVGQEILIPYNPDLAKKNKEDKDKIYHVVEKGETLYSLSRKYDVPVGDLMKLNSVDLKVGQKIVVGYKKKDDKGETLAKASEEQNEEVTEKQIKDVKEKDDKKVEVKGEEVVREKNKESGEKVEEDDEKVTHAEKASKGPQVGNLVLIEEKNKETSKEQDEEERVVKEGSPEKDERSLSTDQPKDEKVVKEEQPAKEVPAKAEKAEQGLVEKKKATVEEESSEEVLVKNEGSVEEKEAIKEEDLKEKSVKKEELVAEEKGESLEKATSPSQSFSDEQYPFDPEMKQVLVIPFDPYLYFSDADAEFAERSNISSTKVRQVFRRRLNAMLRAPGYETIHLLGGRAKDSLSDINKIYSSVTYNYQEILYNPNYEEEEPEEGEVKKATIKESAKAWFSRQKEKISGNASEGSQKAIKAKDNGKYFGVIVKNPEFFSYFNYKYSVDYYVFINQFEVKTNYENCLDRATQNYERVFITHFSIFDEEGNQVAGNKFRTYYHSNSNYIYDVVSDNVEKIANRIIKELPPP